MINIAEIYKRKKLSQNIYGGYLTVYMTLVLTVVLSLFLVLTEGARQNGIFMEAECVTDVGLNSILAEYHRELLHQYNLFAIDSSYGGSLPRVKNTESHLDYYLRQNLTRDDIFLDWLMYRDLLGLRLDAVELKKARMLTDEHGGVFRRRAAEAMWDELNLNLLQELDSWMNVVESEQLTKRDIAAEKRKLDKKLDGYDGDEKQISETEWITIHVTNPTNYLEKMRNKGILTWVVNVYKLSEKALDDDNLIGFRMRAGGYNQGNLKLEESSEITALGMNGVGTDGAAIEGWGIDGAVERFLFQEYLLKYMGHYGAEKSEHVLDYQIEYLLIGGGDDQGNLKTVVERIFALREVANTMYLYSDEEKYTVADVLASVLALAMEIPEAASVIKQILLLGWAFAESIYDMQCLMAGERIPLIKTSSSWHFGLKEALTFGGIRSKPESEGLSYEDYLRIMMFLEDEDVLTERAMDMVEADIRKTPGNSAFRLDGCLDAVEVCVRIKSAYGYNCEVTRQKGYSTQ